MHTVCELRSFQRAAADAGMSASEITTLIDHVAAHPAAGDEMAGTGGCRKLRWARPGRGKSGGYRIVTFFTGADLPVFLVTVFPKSLKANLTMAERNGLATLTKAIVAEYRTRPFGLGRTP